MWDVKHYQKHKPHPTSHSFYLNYVGCKGELFRKLLNHIYESFTLTMWDVKEVKKEEPKEPEVVFYLNYVGCKES